MNFTIVVSIKNHANKTFHRKLVIDERNYLSLVPNKPHLGTKFTTVEEVREVLFDALRNPKKYEELALGHGNITLEVDCYCPKPKLCCDKVTLQFQPLY